MVLFILFLLLPMELGDIYPITKTIGKVGCSIIFLWAIYAMVIKRDEWIVIEKKTTA